MTIRFAAGTRVVLDVLLTLALLGVTLFALWLVASPFLMSSGDRPADVAVPVAVGSGSLWPSIPVDIERGDSSIRNAVIVGAQGELRLETTAWGLQFGLNLGMLVGTLLVLYSIFLLRGVVRTAEQGDPFNPRNASSIRLMALVSIAVGLVRPLADYLASRAVLGRLAETDPVLAAPLTFSGDPFILGFLLLILAQIWARGSELQRDQSLTI
jgi:hypothetical protein